MHLFAKATSFRVLASFCTRQKVGRRNLAQAERICEDMGYGNYLKVE